MKGNLIMQKKLLSISVAIILLASILAIPALANVVHVDAKFNGLPIGRYENGLEPNLNRNSADREINVVANPSGPGNVVSLLTDTPQDSFIQAANLGAMDYSQTMTLDTKLYFADMNNEVLILFREGAGANFMYPVVFRMDGSIATSNANLTSHSVNAATNSGLTKIGEYKTGEWIKVQAQLNTTAQTYSVWINGEQLVTNAPLDPASPRIDSINNLRVTASGATIDTYTGPAHIF